jgi:hypothetical protein
MTTRTSAGLLRGPIVAATTIVRGLEGAMLVARPYGDIKRLRSAASLLIDGLAVER